MREIYTSFYEKKLTTKEDKTMLIMIVYFGFVFVLAIIISGVLKVLELADKEIKKIKGEA